MSVSSSELFFEVFGDCPKQKRISTVREALKFDADKIVVPRLVPTLEQRDDAVQNCAFRNNSSLCRALAPASSNTPSTASPV